MRILLVWPQALHEVLAWGNLGAIAEPLALEYLAAGVKLDAHEVQVLDLRLHPDALDATLLEFNPHVVGVTGYSMHVLAALSICRRVKRRLPECTTVAGGHHATLMPEDFFEPEVDFVITGEGVQPFRALLRALERHAPDTTIPGVWSRIDGQFLSGGEQPPFNINDLPPPDRSVVAPDRNAYFIDEMKPVALIRTTVGCPYRCNFCSLWKIMDSRYHIRDDESVVAELATIQEEWVFMVDDEAFINRNRMTSLVQAIKAAGLQKRYFAYCRIDTLLRERQVLAAWHEVGLDRLFIGIEAISDEGMRDFNKRLKIAQVEAGLKAARELGIKVWGQFIVKPEFTQREFKHLVRFIERYQIDRPSFTILTPIPGTELLTSFDAVIERQPNGRPNWELFDFQHLVTQTRLPKDRFMQEYQGLRKVFVGNFVNYWATNSQTVGAF